MSQASYREGDRGVQNGHLFQIFQTCFVLGVSALFGLFAFSVNRLTDSVDEVVRAPASTVITVSGLKSQVVGLAQEQDRMNLELHKIKEETSELRFMIKYKMIR